MIACVPAIASSDMVRLFSDSAAQSGSSEVHFALFRARWPWETQVMDRSGEPSFEQLWAPNVLGVFQLTRELLPHMKEGARAAACCARNSPGIRSVDD